MTSFADISLLFNISPDFNQSISLEVYLNIYIPNKYIQNTLIRVCNGAGICEEIKSLLNSILLSTKP